MSSTIVSDYVTGKVTRAFTLSPDKTSRLSQIAKTRRVSESEVVERALDIFFSLAEIFEDETEHQGYYRLSEAALRRVWDNDQDAVYDHWRDLYGVPEG